jgi:hypothetical protein
VAHNVATRHVIRQRRIARNLVSIEKIEELAHGCGLDGRDHRAFGGECGDEGSSDQELFLPDFLWIVHFMNSSALKGQGRQRKCHWTKFAAGRGNLQRAR